MRVSKVLIGLLVVFGLIIFFACGSGDNDGNKDEGIPASNANITDLIGLWGNGETGSSGYSEKSIVFSSDNTGMHDSYMFGMDDGHYDFLWHVEDGIIYFSYEDGSENSFPYSISGDILSIDGNDYEKVIIYHMCCSAVETTSSSDSDRPQ